MLPRTVARVLGRERGTDAGAMARMKRWRVVAGRLTEEASGQYLR